MANDNINIDVKSNIGDVAKDAGNAASEFKVMGVSLNGVKKGFASAAVTAKGMFGSIKAGLISTGIGAFVVLIASLTSYFKSTKRGAEMLERGLAGFGATVSVITDRLSSFGEIIVSAFEDPQQAIADLWESIKTNLLNRITGIVDAFGFLGKTIKAAMSLDFDEVKKNAAGLGDSILQVATGVEDVTGKMAEGFKSLGNEIKNDVDAAMKLKGATQALRQVENDFAKERANTRQEIQKARLEALDESKTQEERLEALQKANDLELQTTEKAIEIQKEKIRIQKETMALSENMQEDEDALVALEVEKINMQTQSFQTQKRLATEMETLTNEIAANEKAAKDLAAKEEKARIASEKLDLQAFTDFKLERIQDETDEEFKIRIEGAKKLAKEEEDIEKQKQAVKKQMLSDLKSAISSSLDAQGTMIENEYNKEKALAEANGKSTEAIDKKFEAKKTALAEKQKKVKIAMAMIDMYQSAVAAYGQGMAVPAPAGLVMGPLAAGLAVAAGLANINSIMQTDVGSGGGGGGATATAPTGSGSPAPQMMSGAFDLSGGTEPDAFKAFVVTDEMTNSQNQLANIRRRATI
jgi:hypothetical protein